MAFYRACEEGNIDKVKLLLLDRLMGRNQVGKYNRTPFYVACCNGHLEIVNILLADPRIDPYKHDNDGWTCDSERKAPKLDSQSS